MTAWYGMLEPESLGFHTTMLGAAKLRSPVNNRGLRAGDGVLLPLLSNVGQTRSAHVV